jgi:hypothetical protein
MAVGVFSYPTTVLKHKAFLKNRTSGGNMWDVTTQRDTEAPPLTASRPAKCRPREVGPHGLIPIAALNC